MHQNKFTWAKDVIHNIKLNSGKNEALASGKLL